MRAFAWAGALLFCGALAWFAYQYFVTFAQPAAGAVDSAAVTRNVVLFSAFALHHSLFARTPLRRWVQRRAPRGERSLYVWIASALFIAVCSWWAPLPGVVWQASGAGGWWLIAVQVCGVLLTARAAAVIDIWDLSGVRQAAASATPHPEARQAGPGVFSTAFPYGWVRHPIYLGWLLIVWPVSVMTTTRLVFAIVSSAYLVMAIPLEERTLRRTAPAYARYQQAVRWRLLPGLY